MQWPDARELFRWIRRSTNDGSGSLDDSGEAQPSLIDSSEPTPTSTAAAPTAPAAPKPVATRDVVLVAEDNALNQQLTQGLLESLGYAVEIANDGLEAVAAVTAFPDRFVAVLMDCRMPRLDGFEATRVIRHLEAPGVRVPVVALTASTLPGERKLCVEAGMDDLVIKPVEAAALRSTLTRLIVAGPEMVAALTERST